MRKLLLAIPFMFFAAHASAACTEADIQKKAMEMMTVAQQLGQKNPTAAQEWSVKATKAAQELQTKVTPTDLSPACKMYDDLIADAKKSL